MKNFLLIISSVIIAVFLFAFVHSQGNSIQRVLVVPVEIQNLPREKIILLPSVRQAQVTIQGPSFLIAEVASAARVLKVKLPTDVGNRHEVTFSKEDLGLPPAVEVVRIEPSSMQLTLDNRISKQVPIVVPRIGKINENFKLLEFKITPQVAEINGAETEVKQIASIQTFPLDLRELKGEQTIELPLRDSWEYSKTGTNSVEVFVKLIPISVEQTYGDLPIEVRTQNSRKVTLTPEKVAVRISGLRNAIKDLKEGSIVPFVKLDSFDTTKNQIQVEVQLPEGFSLMSVKPDVVNIQIEPDQPPPPPENGIKTEKEDEHSSDQ